ncbi:MAG: hypothetical protein QGG88_02455 [Gammaproteobacteria bacterium]|nr:hypothetical protein [Gammaproteobacteria bacterium]
MINISSLNREEVAGLVGQTLTDHGIDAVLTGGSCVAIYTGEKWTSYDLDMVDISYSTKKQIAAALATIGFQSIGSGNRYFEHPQCIYPIEFPTAPLGIGEESPIGEEGIAEIQTDHGSFKILSTTNCVKDRLINYLLYQDLQCLEQARYVAQNRPVNLEDIQAWLEAEGCLEDPLKLLQLI